MKKMIIALACLVIVVGLWFISTRTDSHMDKLLKDGSHAYAEAMKSKTIVDAEAFFNLALANYVEVEDLLAKRNKMSVKLCENIGNCLLQLRQYPLSIYYYTQAYAKAPREDHLRIRINQIKGKVGLAPIMPFSHLLTLDEKIHLFGLLVVLTIFAIAFAIQLSLKWPKYLAWILGVASLFIFISAVQTQFGAPIHAVVLESTLFYQGPGHKYPKVSEAPLVAGDQVYVLATFNEGRWLKVVTSDNVPGFVSSSLVRVVEP